MPRMPKEDHDHLEAVRRRVEQQETRRRLEEEELEEAEVASWEEEELRQAREISLEEAQKRMDEEIALWLREEEALQEALEESKREGIGKMQEEVGPSQIDHYLVSGGGNHPCLKELLRGAAGRTKGKQSGSEASIQASQLTLVRSNFYKLGLHSDSIAIFIPTIIRIVIFVVIIHCSYHQL